MESSEGTYILMYVATVAIFPSNFPIKLKVPYVIMLKNKKQYLCISISIFSAGRLFKGASVIIGQMHLHCNSKRKKKILGLQQLIILVID